MDMRVVAFVLSKLLLAEAVILLLPLGLSLAARDGMTWVFSVAAMLTGLVAFGCKTYGHTHAASLTMREAAGREHGDDAISSRWLARSAGCRL